MKKWLFLLIAVAWAPFVMAAGFNGGAYPFVYRSAATAQATPTAASGVIYAPPTAPFTNGGVAAFVACEFFNSGTATEFYTVYDSATVANQNTTNTICQAQCSSNSVCSCSGPEVSGPINNGAIVVKNGLTWGSSKALPGPTASPDPQSQVICTYMVGS